MTDGEVPIHLALRRGPQGGKLSITPGPDITTFDVAVRPVQHKYDSAIGISKKKSAGHFYFSIWLSDNSAY